jgi:hypothetical protein
MFSENRYPLFGIMLVPLKKPLRLPEVPGAES